MTELKTRLRVVAHPKICPYLGIAEDIQTCLAYPSHWNLCHHSQPACIVRLSHQRTICLSPMYISCPVFQSQLIAPLPAELRGHRRKATKVLSKKSGSA